MQQTNPEGSPAFAELNRTIGVHPHLPAVLKRMFGAFERISNKPTLPQAYGVAVALVAAALLLRGLIALLAGHDVLPFSTLYPAVIFATLFGGTGPGIFAAAAGGLLVWWISLPPAFSFSLPISRVDQVRLITYVCGTALIVWGGTQYRSIATRLRAEVRFRQLTVEELAHRLKNKIATVDAILRQQLRDQPEVRDKVSGLLLALARTDDLIAQTQFAGARLEDIVAAELGPYDQSRVASSGPSVLAPPKLAASLALTLHELATNAAKYGALSTPEGRVRIAWRLVGPRVELSWIEEGGPAVDAPTRSGFGSRLMARALIDFDGAVEREFARDGLRASLSFSVAQSKAA